MRGKSAIVTGSTSGIGQGVAECLAAAGVNVMLNGFGEASDIEALRARLADHHGIQCRYSPADMSRPDEIRAMVHEAEDAFGAVDILVNNAGIQFVSPVQDFPDEKWDAVLAINLSAAFHAIKAAMPGMRSRHWGRIINIASAHGQVASANKAGYVAAKHGLIGLTKVVGLETAETSITCNAICPGWVLTPLVRQQIEVRAANEGKSFEQAATELLTEKQPSKQFVTPEQIGETALFLCSPGAEQITGTTLNVDGGWVAQ
ncbi:3-hydroxybutyrate dehydrogenase [Magnetospira sp. QH-2]|uniref:3-hydroxybutyrate dehydrogenase n=1 Tax=Magnetospira sp. (strain QH-2) TaxID=1288970 RepID=UPI0003E816EE|nr:3-hydroxybutyrate dehydrogenase [Magnetospira sp. QH-2]CCQ73339.1 D-beta-hydroxybutyrate dehydrogenase (BDH) (3-hydroxybutyrate dehydrogenase) (3-HBDH) [Magnetospira sp. QH-2]